MEPRNPNDPRRVPQYNRQEQELIRQLMESRLSHHETLEYEELDDYEVPLSSKLPMLTKPSVSIKYRKLSFSMASIRLFAGIQHVLPILNRKKQRLSVIPLADEESSSVMWARQRESDGKWYNREIISLELVEDIYNLMGWNRNARYKVPGHIANSPRGLILIYELSEAPITPKETTEYTDPDTGEIKKHKILYYPEEFKGRLGRSYNDYMSFHQQSIFDALEEITGNSYSDAPVRREGPGNGNESNGG